MFTVLVHGTPEEDRYLLRSPPWEVRASVLFMCSSYHVHEFQRINFTIKLSELRMPDLCCSQTILIMTVKKYMYM